MASVSPCSGVQADAMARSARTSARFRLRSLSLSNGNSTYQAYRDRAKESTLADFGSQVKSWLAAKANND